MDKMLECPHCASADLEVMGIEYVDRPAPAVHCKERGAFDPPSHADNPKHAVYAWNQRMGRMSLVK